MEQNKGGLLAAHRQGMAGQVTHSVPVWHQLGDTLKDKAKRKPGFPSPYFTGGETEARTGVMIGLRCQKLEPSQN